MRYNNRFFATREDAMAFKRRHGGHLLAFNPRGHRESKINFYAEMAVAQDARGEIIDPEQTPFCVAWNEKEV